MSLEKRREEKQKNKNERKNSQHRERLCPVVLDAAAQGVEPSRDVVPLPARVERGDGRGQDGRDGGVFAAAFSFATRHQRLELRGGAQGDVDDGRRRRPRREDDCGGRR